MRTNTYEIIILQLIKHHRTLTTLQLTPLNKDMMKDMKLHYMTILLATKRNTNMIWILTQNHHHGELLYCLFSPTIIQIHIFILFQLSYIKTICTSPSYACSSRINIFTISCFIFPPATQHGGGGSNPIYRSHTYHLA